MSSVLLFGAVPYILILLSHTVGMSCVGRSAASSSKCSQRCPCCSSDLLKILCSESRRMFVSLSILHLNAGQYARMQFRF